MNVLRIDKGRVILNLSFFQSFGKKVTVIVKANALNTIPYENLTRCSSLRGKRVAVAK